MMSAKKTNLYLTLAVCGFLALAVAIVFGQTLQHEFINFDDDVYVYDNRNMSNGLTSDSITWAFTSFDASNWHPLTWLSHLVDCQIYGTQHPGGHHATNVLLHAAVAIFLFLILKRMTGDLWPSAFVAAVFAIHPLRAESVAWVAERKDVLSGLFFMLTLWAYLGYVRRPFSIARYALVAVLFALGLMSKPMLVTLPLLLLLLDYWPLGRIRGLSGVGSLAPVATDISSSQQDNPQEEVSTSQYSWWQLIAEKMPLLAMSVVSCVVTSLAQQKALANFEIVTLPLRITNALVAYGTYLGQFFFPRGLAIFYPYPVDGHPAWKVACVSMMLIVITIGVLTQWRKRPWLLVGWFWYLGMLVPVIGFVQVGGQSMADRYTYLPQIGLAIALGWAAANFADDRLPRRLAFAAVSVVAVIILMIFATRQTAFWRNGETIWIRASDCTASNIFAHNNMGNLLAKNQRVNEAILQYQKALEINPRSAITHNNLGNVYASRGKLKEAAAEYRLALKYRENYAQAHNNLGNVLAWCEHRDDAIAEYQKALEIDPDYAEAYNNLGAALAGKGEFAAAVDNFNTALKINRFSADAHNNLGTVLEQQGKIAEAADHWRELVHLNPTNMEIVRKLAWTLATHPDTSVRNGKEAVVLAEWGVRYTHDRDPAMLGARAAAYAEDGRFSDAAKSAETAIALAKSSGNSKMADALREQLGCYQKTSPYREKIQIRPPTHESTERK
jgi:protein O-mannosyl-transferase